MNKPKIRSAVLVGALALTATAWAATNDGQWVVTTSERPVWTDVEPASQEPIAVTESLAPNETVVTETTAPAPVTHTQPVIAVTEREVAQPPITIEERRLTLDERIQADVMDRIAQNGAISGKIGVVSEDARVVLTGYTTTAAQAQRAGRIARGVSGVRDIDNQIRPRIGGTV